MNADQLNLDSGKAARLETGSAAQLIDQYGSSKGILTHEGIHLSTKK